MDGESGELTGNNEHEQASQRQRDWNEVRLE